MGKDAGWSVFFSDERRYADLINGFALEGRQIVKETDVREMDTKLFLKVPFLRRNQFLGKFRDISRRIIFGINFVIVGLENQEEKDYAYPVRNMLYDAGEYEKQLSKIKKLVRRSSKPSTQDDAGAPEESSHPAKLSRGEYMYGFRRTDRLHPVVTFLLYAGEEPWDAPLDLWGILDFTDVPEEMKRYIQNYKVNLIDIRRLEDTSMLQTDVRHVFDFIRCSNDKTRLKDLVENEKYFQHMDEDAFDVTANYAHINELDMSMEDYHAEGGINMCKAIQEMIEDGRNEGRSEGYASGRNDGYADGELKGKITIYVQELHLSPEEISQKLGVDTETVQKYL
jgi:hypothetical protein